MKKRDKQILIVGAGFAGATIARELAEFGGYQVDIIDQRSHIAGNAYDQIHSQTGGRYHVFGPHIFHTNDERIYSYLSRFTEWELYRHKVKGVVEGVGDVPIPINIDTVNKIYGQSIKTDVEFKDYLNTVRLPVDKPENAYDYLASVYGLELTELFFSRYTKKMWGQDLKATPVATVARIPVRADNNPYYFNDRFQFMPLNGYTRLFENLLDHEDIDVSLSTRYERKMELEYDHVFNSMPIDEYYGFCFGDLPYRSIKFEHKIGEGFVHDVPTINFTDNSIYTRKTCWHLYPGCTRGNENLVTYERPCDYKDNNMERYYPVKTVDNQPQKLYAKYRELAAENKKVTHVGRCGQYQYYDMHQVIANSIKVVKNFIGK